MRTLRLASVMAIVLLGGPVARADTPSSPVAETIHRTTDPFVLGDECLDCSLVSDDHFHAHGIKEGRPDTHAPASLMGDHVHHRGEFMFEYKFMNMFMDDNRAGTDQVSDVAALDVTGIPFMATPTRMYMNMHMFHLMYGLNDSVTLYAMPMWTELTMDHLRRNGTTFRTHNEGFDDTVLGALVLLHGGETDDLILNLGCSVPTGEIGGTTDRANPMGATTLLPYPMRLGSGTFDARPGITYKKYWESSSAGAQFQTDLPIGRNYRGYSVGNEYRLNGWFAHRPIDPLALTFRTGALWRENFDGQDAELNPNMISTARTDMRGGFWLDLGFGAIYQLPDGSRLNFEFSVPVAQDLDGVQLETETSCAISWSKGF